MVNAFVGLEECFSLRCGFVEFLATVFHVFANTMHVSSYTVAVKIFSDYNPSKVSS